MKRDAFTQDQKPGESVQIPGYVLTLMEGLNCPRSLAVAILLRYGEWKQVVELTCDPVAYQDSEEYWAASAATDFLRKCRDLPSSEDLEEKARKSFFESEHGCLKTNLRLGPYLEGWSDPSTDIRILDFVSNVRKTVFEMIGSGPEDFVTRFAELGDEVFLEYADDAFTGRFGPGATQSDSSRECTVAHKLSSVPTYTSNAASLLIPWMGTKWADAQADLGNELSEIRGNSFFTVPKDATKLRGCSKEPSINVFYQMWYGRLLRKRLKSWGINLQDGQPIHRLMAQIGSLSGNVATIDLRSASDTVCKVLVELCLPPRWFKALSGCRSTHTQIDKKWVLLEKFSSMGNGFTFELETVIFAAIAWVACRGQAIKGQTFSVYGDDIIVPTDKGDDVMAALAFFGFTPNKRKTFLSGPFRESCGGDFFSGVSVRPHLLEEFPHEPQHYITLANGLRRLAWQDPCVEISSLRWSRIRRAWFQVQDNIPNSIRRCRGPEALGDLVIHDEERKCESRTRSSIRYYRSYRPAQHRWVRWSDFSSSVQLAAALYGVSRNPMGNLIPRDSVTGYKVGWVPCS